MQQELTHPAVRDFLSRIQAPEFPCVGAKSAQSQQRLEFIVAGSLLNDDADQSVVEALQELAAATPRDALFVSQVVLFPATPELTEREFETALWKRLQALHGLDALEHQWDPTVSSDPDSPEFSLSLGGRGFYVIGLHPSASRMARRFDCAALVFNLHSQFETLRADGRYPKLQQVIIDRDLAYSGSSNPMLQVHGVASEARQYSGRKLEADWQCPFSTAKGARSGH